MPDDIETRRVNIINRMMECSGYTRAEAQFAAAQETGLMDGDVIEMDDETDIDT